MNRLQTAQMMCILVLIVAAMGFMATPQQAMAQEELARRLSAPDPLTRSQAVEQVVASGTEYIPTLLAWTKNPPPQIFKYRLYMGMAKIFGELRTKEAIPFLVENINIGELFANANVWMKTPPVIEARLPAVEALIKIGPDASKALIERFSEPMTERERLAAIFVVARIGDPNARRFLEARLGAANDERSWAEEGLKLLDSQR